MPSSRGGDHLAAAVQRWALGVPSPVAFVYIMCGPQMNTGGVSLSFSQGKLNLKEFDDSVNREDGILKPCYSPNDFIDKLVVNFENFLEVVSAENPGKGCENILGGEKNEYVASPNRPYCPTVSTEIPPRGPQCLSSGMLEGIYPETRERLIPPTQGCGPDHLCEEGAPNPYLKNSVTTREFLVSEKLPEQIHREV